MSIRRNETRRQDMKTIEQIAKELAGRIEGKSAAEQNDLLMSYAEMATHHGYAYSDAKLLLGFLVFGIGV